MAQFTVKWPNGAEVTFEGDVTFEELQEFLEREEAPASLQGSPTPPGPPPTGPLEESGQAPPMGQEQQTVPLDPHALDRHFEQVGARNDIERLTVMAYAARQAGLPGIDIETAERIYRELSLPMPGRWRATFGNAQTRGYIVREGRGTYRPTAAGDNFARLGQRRPSPVRRRRQANQSSSDAGGGED